MRSSRDRADSSHWTREALRPTWALRDCSIRIPAGRVAGLVGPNGAGKSTFLNLAAGLSSPTVGEIRVFGRSPQEHLLQLLDRVGFVAQDTPLYGNFMVGEMLTFGRRLNRRWDQPAAEERLRRLDIPFRQRIGQLSGGQRAQVALALALGKRPDLLRARGATRPTCAPRVHAGSDLRSRRGGHHGDAFLARRRRPGARL
jgi:ABC-type multidrug transport system ATPase subunit